MGVDEEMNKLSSTLTTIQAVLEDAEEKQLEDKAIRNWLCKLNDLTYEIDDILDECAIEVSKLEHKSNKAKSYLKNILYRYKIGRRMKEVTKKLNAIAAERAQFHLREMPLVERQSCKVASIRETCSVINESHPIYGRDEEKEKIVDILVNKVRECKELSILPIIGIGGLGKTTLAQVVFNDERVAGHFDIKIWVCVSDNFDYKTLIKEIIESASRSGSASDLVNLDNLQRQLSELLSQKRYLLVLDDVWNQDQEKWSVLKSFLACGSSGASIIVTTRLKSVADIMSTFPPHQLTGLSEEDCWFLFKQRAFGRQEEGEYPNLEAIGKQIVKKCAGVPLAAKTLGGLLRFKRNEKEWIHVKESEIWNLPQTDTSILPALRLSYNNLPLRLRQCFALCAIFPKDSVIEKKDLILMWVAHGCISATGTMEVEDIGNEIWNELVLRCLFQDVSTGYTGVVIFKMHDLVHDLAQSIMENKVLGTQVEINNRSAPNTKVRQVNLKYDSTRVAFPTRILPEMDLTSAIMSYSRLRILNSSDSNIDSLPSEIGKLKHLRCLNLSNTSIRSLPNAICSLWNLKILNLNYCSNLVRLPKNMRYMRNLRHLFLEQCFSLSEMPPSIGELASLQTLSYFIVGHEKTNQLKELELLNLGGSLFIKHLERVNNFADAKKANLAKKQNLCVLSLHWEVDDNASNKSGGEDVDEKVFEALQPHPNLKKLWTFENLTSLKKLGITGLSDHSLPEDDEGLRGLKSVTNLQIWSCKKFTYLPKGWIPHLTALEKLTIQNCPEFVEFPEEIKYLQALRDIVLYNLPKMICLPDSFQHLPLLQSLHLHDLPRLTLLPDWLGNLISLNDLKISYCQNIASLPATIQGMKNLKDLTIWECPELERRCEKEKGEDWHKIAHIPNLRIDGAYTYSTNQP
ncbi:hypothetical protein RD792_000350 [Penstemon davidsonii]|uniref:Uncharacterized protein n=1 Tax=Penstemon davidsonii TaxID=160366 RepID=A0ABR0DLH6_9LAMI|nr:hypothetical protein RD792_000350 [Penstemon davidsonii]